MIRKPWIASSTSGPTLFDRFVISAQFGLKKRRETCGLICVGFPSSFIPIHRPKGRRSHFVRKTGRRFARGSSVWPETSGSQSTLRNET